MSLYELPPRQFKLLEILTNPEYYNESVTKKCELAGITTRAYYYAMHNEKFQAALEKTREDILRAAVLPVVRQSIKAAMGKSHSDRKMILEMAGAYIQKVDASVEHTVNFKSKEDAEKF